MTSEEWYCQFDDETAGPFSIEELEYLVQRNRLTRETFVRRSSTETWISAEGVPGLFARPCLPVALRESAPAAEKKTGVGETRPSEATLGGRELSASEPPRDAQVVPPPLVPPPISRKGPPVWQGITAGVAAILMLILLAMLFWHGDGGDGTAKGTGGDAAGVGSGSGTGGGGTGENGNAEGEASGRGGGSDGDSDGFQHQPGTGSGNPESPADETGRPMERPREAAESQGDEKRETTAEGRGGASDPSSEGENEAEKESEPIPKMENAVVLQGDRRKAEEEASDNGSAGAVEGAAGGSGTEGTFFGIKAKGRKFVYIVDRSGSMAGGPFESARKELIASLKHLTEKQSFYVFFFNNSAAPMFGTPGSRMRRATKKNIHELEVWVDTVRCGGGTDPTTALQEAIKMKPDAIFLLSDGAIVGNIPLMLRRFNTRRVPPASRSRETQSSLEPVVTINTIGFANRAGEAILKQIAQENNGEYRFVPFEGFTNPSPGFPAIPAVPGSFSALDPSPKRPQQPVR